MKKLVGITFIFFNFLFQGSVINYDTKVGHPVLSHQRQNP